jgi:hypothetical protein
MIRLIADGCAAVEINQSVAKAHIKFLNTLSLEATCDAAPAVRLPNVDLTTLQIIVAACEAVSKDAMTAVEMQMHFQRGGAFSALPPAVARCFAQFDRPGDLCSQVLTLFKVTLAAVYLDCAVALLLSLAKLLDMLRPVDVDTIRAAFERGIGPRTDSAVRSSGTAVRRMLARNRWLRPAWIAMPSTCCGDVGSEKLEAVLVGACARSSDVTSTWARVLGVGAPSLLGVVAVAQLGRLVYHMSPACKVVWGNGVGVVRSATSEGGGATSRGEKTAAMLQCGDGGWWSATKRRRGEVERLQLAFDTHSLVKHVRLKSARKGQECRVTLLVALAEPRGALARSVISPWSVPPARGLELPVQSAVGLAAGLEVEVRHIVASGRLIVGLDELVVLGHARREGDARRVRK